MDKDLLLKINYTVKGVILIPHIFYETYFHHSRFFNICFVTPLTALVQEQNLRKQKLGAELAKQIEEKARLQNEVDMMRRELEWRERQRKQNADRNTKVSHSFPTEF